VYHDLNSVSRHSGLETRVCLSRSRRPIPSTSVLSAQRLCSSVCPLRRRLSRMISPTMSPHRRSVVIVVVAVFLVVVLTATSVQNNLANGRIVAARPPLRSPYTLQRTCICLPKSAPSRWRSGPQLRQSSLAPASLPPNGISIGSSVFAQLARVPTHRHADYAACGVYRKGPHICTGGPTIILRLISQNR